MKRIKVTDRCRGPALANVPAGLAVAIGLAHMVAHEFPGGSVGYAHPELRRRGSEGRSAASTLCLFLQYS